MHDNRTDIDSETIDEQLTARYAALASEVTPRELDHTVLQQARAAAQSTARRFSFMDWARPIAFAATGVLCVALILDLNDSSIVATQPAILPAEGFLYESLPENEPAKRTAADTANALRREKAAAPVSSKMSAPQPPIDNEIDTQSMSIGATAPAGRIDQPVAPIREDASLDYIPPEVGFATGPDETTDSAVLASRQCQSMQKADPEVWWLCISALRSAGLDELADEELASLQATFADFALPE